ncbi:MAG: hypothetical protein IMY84_05515 [Chloroflexi bacterium]|nr:hypothetical protein [Chloroflexota bacterium]
MKNEFKAGIVAAILIMAVAVLFSSVLNKSQNVVPLFLVPAFLFAGYAVGDAGFKVWAAMTIALTILLAVLYALP